MRPPAVFCVAHSRPGRKRHKTTPRTGVMVLHTGGLVAWRLLPPGTVGHLGATAPRNAPPALPPHSAHQPDAGRVQGRRGPGRRSGRSPRTAIPRASLRERAGTGLGGAQRRSGASRVRTSPESATGATARSADRTGAQGPLTNNSRSQWGTRRFSRHRDTAEKRQSCHQKAARICARTVDGTAWSAPACRA